VAFVRDPGEYSRAESFGGTRIEDVPLRSLGCHLHLQVLKFSVGFMVGICKCRYISFRWQTLEAHLTPAVEEL
jgi:hypothetical protein